MEISKRTAIDDYIDMYERNLQSAIKRADNEEIRANAAESRAEELYKESDGLQKQCAILEADIESYAECNSDLLKKCDVLIDRIAFSEARADVLEKERDELRAKLGRLESITSDILDE